MQWETIITHADSSRCVIKAAFHDTDTDTETDKPNPENLVKIRSVVPEIWHRHPREDPREYVGVSVGVDVDVVECGFYG